MLDLTPIRAVSFDCYGTLIDWQSGIWSVLVPALAQAGIFMDRGALFGQYAMLERRSQQPPYKPYRQVLEQVAVDFFEYPERADPTLLWKSLPDWPAFDETPGVLRAIQKRYKVAIASNIDDDLFAHSESKLGINPDVLVTAEQVRSYKPRLGHFRELLKRLDLQPQQVLHIAESRYHDIEPANRMGMPTIWINRARGHPSASGDGSGEPMLILHSLSELAETIKV